MNDEDFRALIAVLEEQFRSIDASDLADEAHYIQQDSESGEGFLLPPQRRLVHMLEAFDRFLAIQDRATFMDAMQRLRQHSEGEGPSRVVVIPSGEDEASRVFINLAEAPNLSDIRGPLADLIRQIQNPDGFEPPSSIGL